MLLKACLMLQGFSLKESDECNSNGLQMSLTKFKKGIGEEIVHNIIDNLKTMDLVV